MISNVLSATQTQQAAQSKTGDTKSVQPKAKPATGVNDAVQISNAAKALLQEATETPQQTAKEANGGDIQAKRLLAKEAAEKAAK